MMDDGYGSGDDWVESVSESEVVGSVVNLDSSMVSDKSVRDISHFRSCVGSGDPEDGQVEMCGGPAAVDECVSWERVAKLLATEWTTYTRLISGGWVESASESEVVGSVVDSDSSTVSLSRCYVGSGDPEDGQMETCGGPVRACAEDLKSWGQCGAELEPCLPLPLVRDTKVGDTLNESSVVELYDTEESDVDCFTVLCLYVANLLRAARCEMCGYFKLQIHTTFDVRIENYRNNARHARVSAGPDEVPYPIEPTRSVLGRHTIGFQIRHRRSAVESMW